MCDLSILIVSYNTRALTIACLESVELQSQGLDYEVIVVDNDSRDGSAAAIAARFPRVRLLALSENLGFARANNLAARQARGRYLLLLNPDTVVLNRAIPRLLEFARTRVGPAICGGRTLNPDGTLNPTSCWGWPTPWSAWCRATGLATMLRGSRWFDPEALGGWSRDSVRQVDIVTGCLLLLPRELWQQLGGFDPQFFMSGAPAGSHLLDLSRRHDHSLRRGIGTRAGRPDSAHVARTPAIVPQALERARGSLRWRHAGSLDAHAPGGHPRAGGARPNPAAN